MHFILNIFLPFLISLLIFFVAYCWGRVVLEKAAFFKDVSIYPAPLSILLGYGVLVVLSLVLAIFGPMNKIVILFILCLSLIFGRSYLFDGFNRLKLYLAGIKNRERVEQILLLVISFFFLFYLTSAFVPPYRGDALAYHLPEAIGVADNGIGFLINGTIGHFYKNIPASVEVMDSLLYTIGGFTVINLTHYIILLSGLCFAYSFVRANFGSFKGLIFLILCFSLYELFVNGTNPYIDAIMTAWEVTGFFLLLLWFDSKKEKVLMLSGFFYGLALATKYNALYGVILAVLIIIFSLARNGFDMKSAFRTAVYFGLPAVTVAGFWYIKNFILYGNPVYPFYFGHVGFSDEGYYAMVAVIKSFVIDRSILNFLLIPFKFFLNSYYLVMFFAFISWPVIFFMRDLDVKKKYIINLLSFYIFIYTLVWFFLATHQLKFFFVPMVCLLLIFSILLDTLRISAQRIFSPIVLFLAAAVFFLFLGFKIITAKNNYFVSVKKAELAYMVGINNVANFYEQRGMGAIYRASQYINNNFSNTVFLEVWSTTKFFLSKGNRFFYPGDLIYNGEERLTTSTIASYFGLKGVNYVVIDKVGRDRSRDDLILSKVCEHNDKCDYYFKKDTDVEKFVEYFGKRVYQNGGVEIYDLTTLNN